MSSAGAYVAPTVFFCSSVAYLGLVQLDLINMLYVLKTGEKSKLRSSFKNIT